MVARERSRQSRRIVDQPFAGIGMAILGASLVREASALLNHVVCCLAGMLLEAAVGMLPGIARAAEARLFDLENFINLCQLLASIAALIHRLVGIA